MPLDILHAYRHAYKLPVSSAFCREYSQILLSSGVGLRSPTALAARLAQQSQQRQTNGAGHGSTRAVEGKGTTSANGISSRTLTPSLPALSTMSPSVASRHLPAVDGSALATDKGTPQLSRIIGQGRVSKNQLAMAVRRHFNSAGLVEQEAIARFLYKVREEGRGRQFRLRFQP